MASEDLFQNDFSEEPDLGQDVQQNEEMHMEAEEIEADDDEKTTGQNDTSAVSENSPTASANADPTKTSTYNSL